MKARYLVTAVGGDIGSSVIRHLGREFSKESILGCDITPYACGRGDAGEFFLVPPYTDGNAYADFIYKECIGRGVTHILPMTEGEIMVFDRNRQLFAGAGIKLMIQDGHVLKTAMSKYRTALAVKEMGLKSPETWRPGEREEMQYPVIVKADSGCGSKDVRIADNRQEYRLAVDTVSDAIVQEYIGTPEDEYTMGVFSDGKVVRSIAFRRTLSGGSTCMAELVEDDRLDVIAHTIVKAMDVKGSINIQMRKQDGEYYIFEINPRISSTVGFRHLLGFQDVLWWIGLLDGRKTASYRVQEHPPVVGIRTFGEKIFRGCMPAAMEHVQADAARGGVKGEVLLLSNNTNALELCSWLLGRCQVCLYSGRLELKQVRAMRPELIISYNYIYRIKEDIINYMEGNVINLHISLLPWNRGISPNIWSFIDDTPKGVTIHQVNAGFDTGKILYQRQCFFDAEKETFASAYLQLNQAAVELLKDNWDEIRLRKYHLTGREQTGAGSSHSKKDLDALKKQTGFTWDENIGDFLRRYKRYVSGQRDI